jgi:broad specificity phosphatase PhoE
MVSFYICRHGQTEFNKQERLSGWIDTPLTKVGLINAATAAAKLNNITFDTIYSSDLGRAFVTAYLIARHIKYKKEIIRAGELRENSYGDLAAMPVADAIKRYPKLHQQTDYRPPNGESLSDMQARVIGFVSRLAANEPAGTILLVAHDGVIKSLYANFSGEDLGYLNATRYYANDFVASFTMEAGRVVSFSECHE